jgi:hypothetical protein
MGTASSKPENPQATEADQALKIVPSDILTNLESLRGLLGQFNSNDVNFVTNAIKQYNSSVKDPNMMISDELIRKYGQKLDIFHSSLVKHILKKDPVTDEEKKQTFQEATKDIPQLLDVQLPSLIASKTIKVQEEINALSVIQKYPELKNTSDAIIKDIYKLKARNYFFEYKYVQMNILLLVAMQNMYDNMISGINKVVEQHTIQINLRNKELQDVLSKLNMIMNMDMVQVDVRDIDSISKMITGIQTNTLKDSQALNSSLQRVAANAAPAPPGATTGAPAPPGAPPVGGAKKQKGGFVRSQSIFPPQEFAAFS